VRTNCVGKTGLRVSREMCSTCIFRPGNLMSLNSGRLKDMVESVKANDSYVVCHQTLGTRANVVCKGSFDTIYTTPVQLAERLGFIEWIEPSDQ
jgi:hypothetical protein